MTQPRPNINLLFVEPKFNKFVSIQPPPIQNSTEKDQKSERQANHSNQNFNRVTSEEKFTRKGVVSGEKRVRLRDYLFVAKSSVQKNYEMLREQKKAELSNANNAEKHEIKKRMRKNKYSLPNKQIHKIIKKEVEKQMAIIIKSLQEDLDFIKNLDLEHVNNEDLIYLHQVRGLLAYKIAPSVKEINDFGLKRQKNLFQQIINLGQSLAHQTQSQPMKDKLFQMLVKPPMNQVKKEEQEPKPSPNMSSPPLFSPNKFFESMLNTKNPEI